MKIALYFGSFNPIHTGHLIIASYINNNADVDQTWFVISPQNPHKPQKSLLNEYQRKHLVDLAIEGEVKFRASTIEFNLPRPSFTIDTLSYLNEKYPSYEFCIIMGSDSYQNIKNWKNYELLISKYKILVYQRPQFQIEQTLSPNTQILNAPLLDISSTVIRKMIKEKKSIRYLVPDVVKNEIQANSYYRKLEDPAEEQTK